MRRLLVSACALLLLARGGAAADVDGARRDAERLVVQRLAEVAAWAGENSLLRQRDHVYAAILEVDPDNPEARKALKYARGDDARWKQSPSYREPKDSRPANLPEFRRRYGEVAAEFASRLVPLLKDPDLAKWPGAKDRVLADLRAVAPDEPEVRALNGEVDDGGTWHLEETIRARERRTELEAMARQTLAVIGDLPKAEASEGESALGVRWTAVFQTQGIRVVGTTPYDEVLLEAHLALAAAPLYRTAFGVNAPRIPDLSLYFLKDPAEGKLAISNHGGFTPDQRTWAGGLTSVWVPNHNHVLTYPAEKETRVEWAARQPIGVYLRVGLGITEKNGWAWEGIGLYLTHLLTGTHLTYFVPTSNYAAGKSRDAEGFWKRLRSTNTDWMAEGRSLLAESKPGDLRLLLGKDVSAMSAEDVLFGYLFAAYLLEGRPKEVVDFLRRLGKGNPADDAVEKVFGLSIEGLELRFKRWATESA